MFKKIKLGQKKLSFLTIFSLLITPFFFSGCLKNNTVFVPKIEKLEVWGVFDNSDAYERIFSEFKKQNSSVKEIRYKKVSTNALEFEKTLFDEIASGRGPDILMFHNSWLTKHRDKLAPMPESEKNINFFKENFVDVAVQDFIKDNQIYAQPLHMDTLALFYNKDLFNQAGIATPPSTWNELNQNIKKLTKIDSDGNISQSAVALGRSKDPGGINRAVDIFSLLILQGGNPIINESGKAVFAEDNSSRSALDFYVQFAQGGSLNYTWNANMDYSIDSFRYGKTAMMFNYAYQAERLRVSDPKLNFEISPMLQLDLENKKNYANYWGMAVTKAQRFDSSKPQTNADYNTERIKKAWDLVNFITSKKGKTAEFDATEEYLNRTKKIPARRDLIEKVKNDPQIGVFAQQALTAVSWPQPDNLAIDDIFSELIDNVVSGKVRSYEALRQASASINTLMIKKRK